MEDAMSQDAAEVEEVPPLPITTREELYRAIAEAPEPGGGYALPDDVEMIQRVYNAVEPVVASLVAEARSEGREDGRGDMEHLERKWRTEEREKMVAEVVGSALVIAALVSRLGGSVVLTADEMRSTREALRLESSGGTDDARIFRVVARGSS